MIIYFSATGNSEFCAKQLAKCLNGEVVCSNKLIKQNKTGDFYSDKPYVFVFPVYLSTIPAVFTDFIAKSNFTGSSKAYFVATCASTIGASVNVGESLCLAKNLEFMGATSIVMPQNYIILFSMTEADECVNRKNNAVNTIKGLAKQVDNQEKLNGKKASNFEYSITMFVEKLYLNHFTKTKKFYATDKCIGCGLCKKQCPMNCISIKDKHPVWNNSCIHCMACINRCPTQAIEYGKKTIGKQRYFCKDDICD